MKPHEQQRLKDFVEANFPFDELKQMAFWDKGTRRTDYQKIADRVCYYFGFESIYEYKPPEITPIEGANMWVVSGPGEITKEGEYQAGVTGWLSTCEASFTCPVCTCEQAADDHAAWRRNRGYAALRCKGCKRKLILAMDMAGRLTVWE